MDESSISDREINSSIGPGDTVLLMNQIFEG